MTELSEGKKAPAFTLPNENGEKISLKDYKGKNIILYFYPKDMTSGCTQEACDFRDAFPKFENTDAVVLGISKDPIKKHKQFIEKYDLPFSLLSDEEGEICEKYGVWKEKSMYGRKYMGIERSTFIIDKEGKINKIFRKVKVTGHVQEVIKSLN